MVTRSRPFSVPGHLRSQLGNKNGQRVKSLKMAGIEKFYDSGVSGSAAQKRLIQLREWENSETNKQPDTLLPSRLNPAVKFGDSVVFLAAAHSGDTGEVERLVLKEGADVDFVNKDGLTALHQVSLLSS